MGSAKCGDIVSRKYSISTNAKSRPSPSIKCVRVRDTNSTRMSIKPSSNPFSASSCRFPAPPLVLAFARKRCPANCGDRPHRPKASAPAPGCMASVNGSWPERVGKSGDSALLVLPVKLDSASGNTSVSTIAFAISKSVSSSGFFGSYPSFPCAKYAVPLRRPSRLTTLIIKSRLDSLASTSLTASFHLSRARVSGSTSYSSKRASMARLDVLGWAPKDRDGLRPSPEATLGTSDEGLFAAQVRSNMMSGGITVNKKDHRVINAITLSGPLNVKILCSF